MANERAQPARSQLKRKRPQVNAGPGQKRRRPTVEELGSAARMQMAESLSEHSETDSKETPSDSPRSDQSDGSYSTSKQEEGASDQESFEKEPEFEHAEREVSDPETPIRENAGGRQPGRGAAAATERRPARQQPDTSPSAHRTNQHNAAPAPTPIRRRRARLHAQVRAKKKAPSTKSNYGGAYRAFQVSLQKALCAHRRSYP